MISGLCCAGPSVATPLECVQHRPRAHLLWNSSAMAVASIPSIGRCGLPAVLEAWDESVRGVNSTEAFHGRGRELGLDGHIRTRPQGARFFWTKIGAVGASFRHRVGFLPGLDPTPPAGIRKVTLADPGEVRSCPKVVQSFFGNREPAQRRPTLAAWGHSLADVGRILPELGQIWSNLLSLDPKRPKYGPALLNSAQVGPHRPKCGAKLPILFEVEPLLGFRGNFVGQLVRSLLGNFGARRTPGGTFRDVWRATFR